MRGCYRNIRTGNNRYLCFCGAIGSKAQKGRKKLPKSKDEAISLAPLDFEQVLQDLLQIHPVENADLVKDTPKKKKKKQTEKIIGFLKSCNGANV